MKRFNLPLSLILLFSTLGPALLGRALAQTDHPEKRLELIEKKGRKKLVRDSDLVFRFELNKEKLNTPLKQEIQLTIPSQLIPASSTKVSYQCAPMNCDGVINEKYQTTWGGIFSDRDRFESHLSHQAIFNGLSQNFGHALNPAALQRIAWVLFFNQNKKLERRPKTWNELQEYLTVIEVLLEKDYGFYLSLRKILLEAAPFQQKTAARLGFLDAAREYQRSCQPAPQSTPCLLSQLAPLEPLSPASTVDRANMLNGPMLHLEYLPAGDDLFFYQAESDLFDVRSDERGQLSLVMPTYPKHRYEVTFHKITEREFRLSIKALKRLQPPADDNLIGVLFDTYLLGLKIDWSIHHKYMSDLIPQERDHIDISYTLCKKTLTKCKIIETKSFNMADKEIVFFQRQVGTGPQTVGTESSLFKVIDVGETILNQFKRNAKGKYFLKYKISINGSKRLSSPLKSSVTLKKSFDGILR